MKRLFAFLVSTCILGFLYWSIDTGQLLPAIAATDPVKLGLSLVLLVALIGLSALRLRYLAQTAGAEVGGALAVKATFAANALNLFMPGKLGDLLKASLLRDRRDGSVAAGLNIAIFEKLADLFAVFACGAAAMALSDAGTVWRLALLLGIAAALLALLISPAPLALAEAILRRAAPSLARRLQPLTEGWRTLISTLGRRQARLAIALALTMLIWAGHFAQISLMAWALGYPGPWLALVVLFPILIVAGLLPLTIAGVGPRDTAIVLLAGPLMGNPAAAALGILFWLRYLVPGLLGLVALPEFGRSLKPMQDAANG